MSDIIEKFKDFVSALGINVRESPTGIFLNSCPACGTSKFKVSFSNSSVESTGKYLGKCFRGACQQGFSSQSYLSMLGVSQEQINELHGLSPEAAIRDLNVDVSYSIFPENYGIKVDSSTSTPKEDVAAYVSTLFNIKDWADHPASLYAISRGVKPAHHPFVKIDVDSNAVVFLCKIGDEVVGFQRRYLAPLYGYVKTKTAAGWHAHENIIVFDKPYSDVIICEGPFSAIGGSNYGFTSVCTFGAAVSYLQLEAVATLLKNKGLRKVHLGFDKDAAGDAGTDVMARFFALRGIETIQVIPEVGTDLNDSWMEGKSFTRQKLELNPYIPRISI